MTAVDFRQLYVDGEDLEDWDTDSLQQEDCNEGAEKSQSCVTLSGRSDRTLEAQNAAERTMCVYYGYNKNQLNNDDDETKLFNTYCTLYR